MAEDVPGGDHSLTFVSSSWFDSAHHDELHQQDVGFLVSLVIRTYSKLWTVAYCQSILRMS